MYSFLNWILSSNSPTDNDLIDKFFKRESNNSLHRYILSLGQDLVYMSSRGKTRTPKHVGLSVTCHKMTQSKVIFLSICPKKIFAIQVTDEMVLGQKPPRQKPPGNKPPLPKPPRQNILFRNFITFVFRMSYGKEISIWFLAVKYIRHGSIK